MWSPTILDCSLLSFFDKKLIPGSIVFNHFSTVMLVADLMVRQLKLCTTIACHSCVR